MTERISFGPFHLFPARRSLLKGTEVVRLGSRALDLLIMLAERPGELVTHRDLLAHAWPDVFVEEANLRVQVAAIRKALDDGRSGKRYISTLPARGYCFIADVEKEASAAEIRHARTDVPLAIVSPGPSAAARWRQDCVEDVAGLLAQTRFVSIIGPDGMGKSLCATSVAQQLAGQVEGVCSVDLSFVSEPSAIAREVLSALDLDIGHDDNAVSRLIEAVGSRHLLLILDNCEHLIDAAAVFAEQLQRSTTSLRLLVTSREALRAQHEHVYRLRPLSLPRDAIDLTAAEALQSEAVQLFMASAAASGHQPTLVDEDATIVAGICRLLEGIPLAIECVAGRVGVHGIRATSDLLSNRPSILWPGRRSAPARHRSLQASLNWSFSLLTEQEMCLLRRLVVFHGPFTLLAAQEVASDCLIDHYAVANALERLVDKSLIQSGRHGKGMCYRVSHLTRACLVETMSADSRSRPVVGSGLEAAPLHLVAPIASV